MSAYYFNDEFTDYEDELKDIIHEHLFSEIRLSLPNKYRMMEFDMMMMPVENRRMNMRSRKLFSTRNFLLSGKLLFIGELAPEIDTVDAIILQSFSGRALTLCLEQFRSAKNVELRSIDTIDASIFKSGVPAKALSSESAVPGDPWYSWFTEKDNLFIVVIGLAGLCLLAGLAMIAVTMKKDRERERRARRHENRSRRRDDYRAY